MKEIKIYRLKKDISTPGIIIEKGTYSKFSEGVYSFKNKNTDEYFINEKEIIKYTDFFEQVMPSGYYWCQFKDDKIGVVPIRWEEELNVGYLFGVSTPVYKEEIFFIRKIEFSEY